MTYLQPQWIADVTGGEWIRPATVTSFVEVGTDSRDVTPGALFIAISGERHDGNDFAGDAAVGGAAGVVITDRKAAKSLPPGVGVLYVRDSRKALGDLARARRAMLDKTCVIAITGSVGKTTTKTLVHAALSGALVGTAAPRSFNNDVGVPLSLLAANDGDDYVVLEIGTNAPGEIATLADIARPDIAIITAVGQAHLAGLGDELGVASEKASLLEHLAEDGRAIINADQPVLRAALPPGPSVTLVGEAAESAIRLEAGGTAQDGAWWFDAGGRRWLTSLPGRHNAMNALFAIAVGRLLEVTDDAIAQGLTSATPPAGRFEARPCGSIEVIDDAYNANPESMRASLETFAAVTPDAPRRVAVLGDMLELGARAPRLHAALGEQVRELLDRGELDVAVFIGTFANDAASAARGGVRGEVHVAATVDAAPIEVVVQPNDAVLLKASRGLRLEQVISRIEALSKATA